MIINKRVNMLLLILLSISLYSSDPQKDILIYNQGTVQVNSEIDIYQNISANVPISGTITVIHDANQPIDTSSFHLGNKPLKVHFVQSTPISSYSNLEVSIYSFQLEGMKTGLHTLSPIQVSVAGKNYQAAPLTIEVAP